MVIRSFQTLRTFRHLHPSRRTPPVTIDQFIVKWKKAELKERAAAQEHFLDLCRLLDHPTPAEADATGTTFCFEKGAAKHGGGEGFADVWKKGFFGWEYKGKRKDLDAAYDQLLRYKDALENPPLLVTCDLDRFVIRTNFTYTAPATYEFRLDQMAEPRNIEILRSVFFNPEALKPGKTSQVITQEAAEKFAAIAESMRQRGLDSAHVAHFLDRVVFCLFAEDVNLLPDKIFTRIVEKAAGDPGKFGHFLGQLFAAMSRGGEFGLESIRHFNGNLFDDAWMPELTADDVKRITDTSGLDWSAVDPTIFGTLFERGLDPSKRSQLGAHFTSKADIELLVDAVVMRPLRQEWEEVRRTVDNLLSTGKKKPGPGSTKRLAPPELRKAKRAAESIVHQSLVRLQNIKVLDPACGSGNFLYVTLQKLKDLEKEVILFSTDNGLGAFLPLVGPWQLRGIEINPYAFDLAQMTVWIGWLQWIRSNGFGVPPEPILRPLDRNFQCSDAILDLSDPSKPKEPEWPKVDFIVGNPPFLGDKFMRRELGDEYVDKLRALYQGRIPGQSDLCCYWFERARTQIEKGGCKRAGLLATQGIRGGANREALKRIKEAGDIFWAISDKDWILDGAKVHVSLIAFDDGTEKSRILDDQHVGNINPNLSATADTTSTAKLISNAGICFIGTTKKAPLDIDDKTALILLSEPNPNGRPSSDVVVPYLNADAVTKRNPNTWIIDFPVILSEQECQGYAAAFEYVQNNVLPLRVNHCEPVQRQFWWRLARPCSDLLAALRRLDRFIVTTIVSKHRLFAWQQVPTNPDHSLAVFARSDDFYFGVLHSRPHEIWALTLSTRLETRPRYTPTTCFETFPLPAPTSEQAKAIANAAHELNELRTNWLNPPEWTREEVLEFPGTFGGPWDRFISKTNAKAACASTTATVDKPQIGLVRYPRLVPRDEASARYLQKRTLTQLYNDRPAWLETAHRKLDAAVFEAYRWDPSMSDEQIVEGLLTLNSCGLAGGK